MLVRCLAVLSLVVAAYATPAEAQFAGQTATATADLNLRSGPGTGYRPIAVIPRGHPVQVHRCAPSWCNVNFRGIVGWASARYLAMGPGMPQPVPPIQLPQPVPPYPPPGFPFPPPGWPGFPPFPPGGPGSPPPGGGTVTISGTLTAEGVECPALRGNDGRLYTLTGNVGPFRPGDRVRVRGRIAEVSFCMQGTTISVDAIAPLF